MTRIVTALTRSLIALVVVAVAGSSQPAQGAGFLLFEQSGRGMGSAYAGEGAIAADATTVYYNPAGMTLLPGTQFAASGFGVYTRSHFQNRGSHFSEQFLAADDRVTATRHHRHRGPTSTRPDPTARRRPRCVPTAIATAR